MVYSETAFESAIQLKLSHGKVNAMDIEFCDQLLRRLKAIEEDPEVSAIVLAGNPRVFSAGIDLKKWLAEGLDYVEPFIRKLESLFEAVFCFPKPIISAIEGHAIAGGCMLATACDYRIISSTAKIGILESRLGVPLPCTAIEIVRHVAKPSAFRQIVSVGATYIGQEAVTAGLADVAVESDLTASVSQAVREFTAIPSPAFEITKQQVRMPVMRIVQQNRKELFERYLAIWKSSQTRDAIAAYVEQRLN